MDKVYVLMSIYKNQDSKDPLNWATSVFATSELADQRKRDLLDYREDIADVVIFPCGVMNELPEIPAGLVRSFQEHRLTKRAADVKPRRAVKAKSRKASRG